MSYEVHSVALRDGSRTVNKKAIMPSWAHPSKEDHTELTRRTYSLNPPASLLQGSAKFSGIVERGTFRRVKMITLKFKVRVQGSASVLQPLCYWFEKIEIRGNSSARVYQTHFHDTLMAHYLAMKSDPELKGTLRDINLDGDEQNFLGYTRPIPVGVSKTFYLALPDSFFNTLNVNLQEQREDLRFEFYPSGSIVKSGGGVVVLDELSVVCDTDDSPLTREEASMIRTTGYLEPIPIVRPNFQVQVGRNEIPLEAVTGKVSHFLLVVRPAGAQPANGWGSMESLGENSQIDLLNPSKQSEYGEGVGVDTAQLRNEELCGHQFKNSVFSTKNKPMLIVPLAHSVKGSVKGFLNGYKKYIGNKDIFQFEIKDTKVNEVQRFATASGANATSGWFYIAFRGARTPALQFNASAPAIKAAIEALPYFQKKSITVTVSNGFDSNNGVIDITIDDKEGSGSSDIELLQVDSAMNSAVAVTQQVAPVHALSAGQHDVYLYAMKHKRISYDNGVFVDADL